MIELAKACDLFLQEEDMPILEFAKEDYDARVERLVERIKQRKLTYMVIYGDREHFSNVEYFTHYDCRFEETLFIVGADGRKDILLGNEGMGYSRIIPIELERHLYQHFSLQGQPRQKLQPLSEILKKTGISENSRVGIVGIKYFEEGMIDTDPSQTYDLPEYIMNTIRKVCPNIVNTTKELTGVPDGIRMRLYTAKEIAWAESVGNRTAAVIQRLLKTVKEGIKEYELAQLGRVGFEPRNTHPLVNFGAESVAIGMGSPRETSLKKGMVGGACYSLRGNLTSRISVFATGLEDYPEELKLCYENFYKKYYEAVVAWYETIRVGAIGGELYKTVMDLIGAEEYGVTLNPGHFTATEEWSNAISREGCQIPVVDGAFMQVDIIASNPEPMRTAICEDAVVIAGEELRAQLAQQYPQVYDRIQKRRKAMKEVLGIHLHDDVLPMSNLNGVYFPFLLNTEYVFAKR